MLFGYSFGIHDARLVRPSVSLEHGPRACLEGACVMILTGPTCRRAGRVPREALMLDHAALANFVGE